MNKWINKKTNEWVKKVKRKHDCNKEQTSWLTLGNEWISKWMNEQMNEWTNECMAEWMNERLNEEKNKWINEKSEEKKRL